MSFHRNFFNPQNSLLMVVGKVDPETFRPLILKKFKSWGKVFSGIPAAKSAQKKYSDLRIKSDPAEVLIVDRPGLNQAQIRLGFKGLSVQSKDRYALRVGNALLGEYFNSRLNSLIRDQLGLTYSIGSGISYSKDLGYFMVSSATKNSSVGQVIRHSIDLLKQMKRGKVLDEEISTAKNYLLGGFPIGVSTLGAVASRWLSGELLELGPDYLNEFESRVSEVTRADVIRAFSESMRLDDLVIVVSGDSREIQKSLKKAGFRSWKNIELKALL